eukprot:9044755-Alexandrium_andersonii.AAC.1
MRARLRSFARRGVLAALPGDTVPAETGTLTWCCSFEWCGVLSIRKGTTMRPCRDTCFADEQEDRVQINASLCARQALRGPVA